jgi:multicomponent Na+:H+ antiporter subunit B
VIEVLLPFALLIILAIIVVGLLPLQNLLAVVALLGAYSFIMATLLVALDAPDVGMTEAAVGAGISTVLLLAALKRVGSEESSGRRLDPSALLLATVTGIILIYGTSGLPEFGDPHGAIHTHVAPYYIEKTPEEIGVPNVITAVLASYRGFDTLGETTVIFTAGLSVLMLLRLNVRRRVNTERDGAPSDATPPEPEDR